MPDYRVDIDDANAHRLRVTLTLRRPAARQLLALPVWIPGSYLVRDFARHLSGFSARQGSREVTLEQRDKTSWVAHCDGAAALVVRYAVYAYDASVRGAYLDPARCFFNGSSVLLRADGREAEAHTLALGRLPAGWQVATAMTPTAVQRYAAADYDELIDHPFLLGSFWRGRFDVAGVEHEFAVDGGWPSFDGERLLADAARICAAHVRFWHGRGKPPFARYVFLLRAADDGHGGLEHRASSALAAPRRDLPRRGAGDAVGDGYGNLLGLISHEYFHAWNVKRLRPRDHAALDLAREQPTRLLWFFEGYTSYYDELLLYRAGVVDEAHYLRQLGRTVAAVQGTPGRFVQSVADASFDAWTKYYRADENTANATVSYYAKGALVALLCDLGLRDHGSSLDAVMRRLWQRSGAGAIGEDDIGEALAACGSDALCRDWQQWVRGTAELPLAERLAGVGVRLHEEPASLAAALGLKVSEGAVSGVQVRQVLHGGDAEAAGVAAGDELLAVDGWRIRRLDDARGWLEAGQAFELLAVRDQRLLTLTVRPSARPTVQPLLTLQPDAGAGSKALASRQAWLRG